MKLLSNNNDRKTEFERIQDFYLKGKDKKLSPKLEKRKAYYELANSLLSTYSMKQAADILRRRYKDDLSRATSYRIVNESIMLFGDIRKTSKEGLKQLLIERQFRLAAKAEADGNLETAERCYEAIAKMGGLNDADFDLAEMYRRLQLPPIQFTDDPKVIHTIDVPHEEQ